MRVGHRAVAAGVALAATAAFAGACGSSSSGTASGGTAATTPSAAASSSGGTTASGQTTVMIKNFSFSPQSLTVSPGTKVTWTNQDSATHTVTANDSSFKSGDMAQNKSFTYVFTKAGTYSYICSIHQYMTGTITVK